jgi:hypothetical protein
VNVLDANTLDLIVSLSARVSPKSEESELRAVAYDGELCAFVERVRRQRCCHVCSCDRVCDDRADRFTSSTYVARRDDS